MGPSRNYVHLGKVPNRRKGAIDVTRFVRKNALVHRTRQSIGKRLTFPNHFNDSVALNHISAEQDALTTLRKEDRFEELHHEFSFQVRLSSDEKRSDSSPVVESQTFSRLYSFYGTSVTP